MYKVAGRELDALIAVKLLGWAKAEYDGHCMIGPPLSDSRIHWAAEWDSYGCPHWMPHYSTEIAAAWEVVEKMGMPFRIMKSWDLIGGKGEGWAVSWCKDGECECFMGDIDGLCPQGNEIWAETAPLAICRAALIRHKQEETNV